MERTGAGQAPPQAGENDWSSFELLIKGNQGADDNRPIAMSRKGELYVSKERTGLNALLTRLAVGFGQMFGADWSAKMHYAESSREERAASSFSSLLATADDPEEAQGSLKLSLAKLRNSYESAFKDASSFRQYNQEFVKDYLLPLSDSEMPDNSGANAKSQDLRHSLGISAGEAKDGVFAFVYNLLLLGVAADASKEVFSKDSLREALQAHNGFLQAAGKDSAFRSFLVDYAEEVENGLGTFALACKDLKTSPNDVAKTRLLALPWIKSCSRLGFLQEKIAKAAGREHRQAAKEFQKFATEQAIASMASDTAGAGREFLQVLGEAFGLGPNAGPNAQRSEDLSQKAYEAMISYQDSEYYRDLPGDQKKLLENHKNELLGNITSGLAIHCDQKAKDVFVARKREHLEQKRALEKQSKREENQNRLLYERFMTSQKILRYGFVNKLKDEEKLHRSEHGEQGLQEVKKAQQSELQEFTQQQEKELAERRKELGIK